MGELKTLKDLDKMKSNLGDFSRDEDLKAEAVKDLICSQNEFNWKTGLVRTPSIEDYIKWKFNLTEEDLKEEGKA
jgi:uncharacterized protein (DUF1015 family)